MEYPFERALVTGASSGIGEAMVDRLAASGVPVVVVARREDRLAALADRHDGIEVLAADLTADDGRAAVVDRIERGDIDLVVNNAGFGSSGNFHDLSADRVADEVDLNVAALTRLSHAAMSTMVPAGRGYLLNVSSIASFQPAPRLAVYAATKAFVTSLSESLHEEVARHGVHVTALCPGLTRTEFISVSNSDDEAGRFPGFAWTDVRLVARVGLSDVVANRTLSVPGVQYKAMTAAANVTPRWIRRRFTGLVQRG